MERKPVLGIFLGEAAGIGPELVAKVVADGTVYKYCRPVLIGDARVLALGQKIAGVHFQWNVISDPTEADLKWSTKTGHRVRVFSSIDFPIRLVVTHHYIRAVLVRCNIQRY
ncbi:hypothetical protein QUG13_16600, partial [Escherichia coli]|nr:hypothetical protein [Escherichia coli]MDM6750462.1 hypothetical protein [Escherichia coli]